MGVIQIHTIITKLQAVTLVAQTTWKRDVIFGTVLCFDDCHNSNLT